MTPALKRLDPARVAFDIDGVAADIITPFLALLEKRHGYRFRPEDVTGFDLEKALGLPPEVVADMIECVTQNPIDFLARPYPGAAEVLEAVSRLEPIVFLTARHQADRTREWLAEVMPQLPGDRYEIEAVGHPDKKTDALKALGRDCLIDDRLETCLEINRAGFEAYVFDQPWNRADENLPRIFGWDHAADLFGVAGPHLNAPAAAEEGGNV